jgi:trehalose-6-phosphatase
VVYLGDDITDIHAFKALTHLRESSSGRIQTLSIGVVGPETALVVRQLADATVPSVTAAADLLQSVSERLKASATMISGARSLGRT